jgi:hypothetical protein
MKRQSMNSVTKKIYLFGDYLTGFTHRRGSSVNIICYNCKTRYEVPAGTMLTARLKYALGAKECSFTCPDCGAKNSLTDEEFRSNDIPQTVVPVTGAEPLPGYADRGQSNSNRELVGRAPTNPIEDPEPVIQQRQAVVRVRGMKARREHSNWSEIMGEFSKGEIITIVDTWSDGENTWVKLGPERWINIEQDGEPVLDLID